MRITNNRPPIVECQPKCPICGVSFDELCENGERDKRLEERNREILTKGSVDDILLLKATYDSRGVVDEKYVWVCPRCSEKIMNNLR